MKINVWGKMKISFVVGRKKEPLKKKEDFSAIRERIGTLGAREV